MRRPLILAASIRAFGHVIYGSKCLSRVSAYNFTARAFSSLHSHKYSPFSALRLHFMKFLVISGECALNVNSNYYRNPAFAFLFLTICTLFLQHLAIYAPICARVLKQFLSTGTMVSPYSLPPPASPELNL